MALYESTFIVRHDMSTQQVENLAETVTNLIKENGGEVTKTEYWGLKTLAYRIKKNRKGHYYFFNVDAPPAAVRELERNLRLNEDVLRYMTVAVEELDPNPSPMMQARSSREDRGRRGGGFGRSRGDFGDRARSRGEATKPADGETMPDDALQDSGHALTRLVDAANKRRVARLGSDPHGFVDSDLVAVNRVLSRVQAEGLARGSLLAWNGAAPVARRERTREAQQQLGQYERHAYREHHGK